MSGDNRVRRSTVRCYARIAAGDHRMSDGNERRRRLTSNVAEDYVHSENWGPSWVSFVCSIFTAGLHLPIQYPMLQKKHRDKLLNVGKSLAFKVMDAYIATNSQEEGMVPMVATLIRDRLAKQDASFVINELDKVPVLDDRLDKDELEYVLAMMSIMKSLVKDGESITVETVATEAKKELQRMAGDNYTMEYENGGGLRQIEYREEESALCIRNVEKDEIQETIREDLERNSFKATLQVAARPEGRALSIGNLKQLKEEFSLREKKIIVKSSSKEAKGPWKPVRRLSDLDISGDEVTARVWYLILNHLNPDCFSFKRSPLALYFEPRTTSKTQPQEIIIDKKISDKEWQVLL